MSDEYKALSKEWPIDELNELRARVKELEAKLAVAESKLTRAFEETRYQASQHSLDVSLVGLLKILSE